MLCSVFHKFGTGVIECQHSASRPKIKPQAVIFIGEQRCMLFFLPDFKVPLLCFCTTRSSQCLLRVALKLIMWVYQFRLFAEKQLWSVK